MQPAFVEDESLDLELYDDAFAVAAPMQALTLGSHTLGTSGIPGQSTRRQQPTELMAPSPAVLRKLQAQLAESQAALRASQLQLANQKAQTAQISEELIDANRQKAGKRQKQPVVVADDASRTPQPESASANSEASIYSTGKGKKKILTVGDRAEALGRTYCTLYRPWPNMSAIEALGDDRPLICLSNYDSRFTHGIEAENRAVTAEVWDSLGEDLEVRYAVAHDPEIAKRFAAGVGKEKSKFISAGSQNIVFIFSGIKGVSAEDLATHESRKACKKLQELSPIDHEHIFPKILFPDSDDDKYCRDGRYFLRCDRVLKIIRSAITGLKSVDGVSKPSNICKAVRRKIRSLTPGMLAMAAVSLIYLTCGDSVFQPLSSSEKTMFDYPWFFDTYFKLIIQGLDRKGSPMADTFDWVNRGVFHHFGEVPRNPQVQNSQETILRHEHRRQIEAMMLSGPLLETSITATSLTIVSPSDPEEVDRDDHPPSDFPYEEFAFSSGSSSPNTTTHTPSVSRAPSPTPGPIVEETTTTAATVSTEATDRPHKPRAASKIQVSPVDPIDPVDPRALAKTDNHDTPGVLPVAATSVPQKALRRTSRTQGPPPVNVADTQPVPQIRRSQRNTTGSNKARN